MIYLLVSDDTLFHRIASATVLQDKAVWTWAGPKKNGAAWDGPGRPFWGDPSAPETFAAVEPESEAVALVYLHDPQLAHAAVEAVATSRPGVKVLVTTVNGELGGLARQNVRRVSWTDVVGDRLEQEMARVRTLERLAAVREILGPAESVALLLQPEPDPDGIASALALRQVLRRNRATAPLVTFAGVTRPENVAMLRLLEIDLEVIRPEDLSRFDRVAMLDVQPNVLQGLVDRVDVVIDHHPEQKGYSARFRDIRSSHGATSTILTEYCVAAEVALSQKLATALLYGIKSDTLFLDREVSKADILAFVHLYPLVNTNVLRRIEKPEIPASAFAAFGRALGRIALTRGFAFVHLGRVEREDVIPQMAELALQLEGAEWSAASGVFGGNVVISVRNAGYQRAAGSVVKALFGEIGCAGGHQAMAKAIVPLRFFRERFGSTAALSLSAAMTKAFLDEIEPLGPNGNGRR